MKKTLGAIPLCKVKAGPRDGDAWKARLTEELKGLIMVRTSQRCGCGCMITNKGEDVRGNTGVEVLHQPRGRINHTPLYIKKGHIPRPSVAHATLYLYVV